ncbi:MAG TPA: hypothetical protein VJZ01_05425 [Lachnospiraceae bacterium]|jgi:hypothetical protein|nr:hypothetical protein [Lachnospiraceae bacterium]
MATKSFLKNVDIRDKRSAKSLITALENAKEKGKVNIQLSRTCANASAEQISAIFGKKV